MSETPHTRRDWFVRNTVDAAKRAGQKVDGEAVSRSVAASLSLADRAKAEGAIRDRKQSKPASEYDKQRALERRSKIVEDKARAMGAKTYRKALPERDKVVTLPILTGVDAERLAAMEARIRLICTPMRPYKAGEPLGAMCRHPKLANRLFMEMVCFSRRLGRYKELDNYNDRQRRYQAEVEKICDASNAEVGFGWWVPK